MHTCNRCGNNNQSKFKTIQKGTYCTACIAFGRFFVGEAITIPSWMQASDLFGDYQLPFSLTQLQLACAHQLVDNISKGKDTLVYACCGAGKTEIIFPLITHCLKQHKKVAIAIPRRDVVLELGTRVAAAFPRKKIVEVYGGHNEELDGDIILCTTHQLYRYPMSFDVLILDEVDAFPLKGDATLQTIARNACKGNVVYLSATPDVRMKQRVKDNDLCQLTLFQRPHGHPLCIPTVRIGFGWMLGLQLMSFLIRYAHKTVLVFVPSIALAYKMERILAPFRSVGVFTSRTEDRIAMMAKIKNKQYQVVICTTVLERGVTIADVQVVVWKADHVVFDEATLIQILGRVGRSQLAYEGEGVLLCYKKSSSVNACVNSLKAMNAASLVETNPSI